jgi:hypothetical protein
MLNNQNNCILELHVGYSTLNTLQTSSEFFQQPFKVVIVGVLHRLGDKLTMWLRGTQLMWNLLRISV